jgi:hypothetical protein
MNKHDPSVNAKANLRGLMATLREFLGRSANSELTDGKEQEGDTETSHPACTARQEAEEAFPPLPVSLDTSEGPVRLADRESKVGLLFLTPPLIAKRYVPRQAAPCSPEDALRLLRSCCW